MRYKDHIEHYHEDAKVYDYFPSPSTLEYQIERRRAEFLIRLLKGNGLTPQSVVLDIGTGGGVMFRQLVQLGTYTTGIDISPKNLREIRDRLSTETGERHMLISADAYTLPFLPNTMDAIILSEVIEHLDDPIKTLSEVSKVLKPGGRLIVSSPYREKLIYHLCIHCNRPTPAHAHLHSIDKQFIRNLIKDHPLLIERECFFGNKLLRLLNIPLYLRHFPYCIWRVCDGAANFMVKKPYYYVMVMKKSQ